MQKMDGRTESQTVRKTVNFQYSTFRKGYNSIKNLRKLTTLELDLKYSKTKSYVKFQPDLSKHLREKCGKLYFQYSKFQKGHNSYKIWRKLTTLELDL